MRTLFAALLLALIASPSFAQERGNDEARPSPNATISQTIGTTTATVGYSRPSVRDREVFGGLVPYDAVWRTGANEATTISFSGDVMVEGQMLPAGTYSLYTIPMADSWTIIFNKTAQQWGTQYDESQDALRVTVEPMTNAPMQEQFEIRFANVTEDSATMILHWDTVGAPVQIAAHSM
ncbi:MAG: DUF2911 domain-containing protein [Rubricoccaceae bacterium]